MNKTIFFFFVLFMGITQPAIAHKSGVDQRSVVVNHEEQYSVVINHEEQYSIWLKGHKLPSGWKATGFVGSKDTSLQYIDKVGAEKNPKIDRRRDALRIYEELKQKKK